MEAACSVAYLNLHCVQLKLILIPKASRVEERVQLEHNATRKAVQFCGLVAQCNSPSMKLTEQ